LDLIHFNRTLDIGRRRYVWFEGDGNHLKTNRRRGLFRSPQRLHKITDPTSEATSPTRHWNSQQP
jgi:hypothetical protein